MSESETFDFEDTPVVPKRPSRRPTREAVDTSPIASVAEPIVREHDRAVAAVEEVVPETVVEDVELNVVGSGSQTDPIDLDEGPDKIPVVPSRRPKRETGTSFMPTPVTEATYDEPSFDTKIPKKGMTTPEAVELEKRQEEEEREREIERLAEKQARLSEARQSEARQSESQPERQTTPSIPSRPARRPVPSEEELPRPTPSRRPVPSEEELPRPTPPSRRPVTSASSSPAPPSRRPVTSSVETASLEAEYKAASTPFQPIEPTVPSRPQRPASRPKKNPVEPSLSAAESSEALEERIAKDKEMGIEVGLGPMDKPVARGVPKDDMALMHDSLTEAASDPTAVRTGPPIKAAVPKDDIALMMEGKSGGIAGDASDFPTSASRTPLEDSSEEDYSHRKVPLDAVAMEEKRRHSLEEEGVDSVPVGLQKEDVPVGLDAVGLEQLKEKESTPAEPKVPAEPKIPARPARPSKSPSVASESVENLAAAREASLDVSKENTVPLEYEEDESEAIIEPAAEEPVVGVGAAEEEIEEAKEEAKEVEEADERAEERAEDPNADNATPIAAAASSVTAAAAAATAGVAAAAAGVAAAVTGKEKEEKDDSEKEIKDDSKDSKDDPISSTPAIPVRPKPVSRTGSSLSTKSPIIPPRPMKRPSNNASSSSLGVGLSSDNLVLSDEKPAKSDEKPAKSDTTESVEAKSAEPEAPAKPAKRPPPVKPKPKIGAAFQAALEEKDKEFKPKPRVPVRSNKISALAKGLDGMFGAAGGPMVFGAPMPKKEVEEEEEVSEAGGGASHDLPAIGVDKEVKEEKEAAGGASRRGRVKGPKRKLPSSAVSPWSCSVISDVWELVPKVKKAVEEKAHEAGDKVKELEHKIAHHKDADSSDEDFEDAREHVVHEDAPKNEEGHVHAVRKPLGAALDAAGHPNTHVDVVRDGQSTTDISKVEEHARSLDEPVETKPVLEESPADLSPVDTTSKSVQKDIPAPVDHSSSIGNPDDALYTANDDVVRFSTSDKPVYSASEPDVIKSATHHKPYESVSEPDVIKSATHHMKEQPFSEAVDVEAAVEDVQDDVASPSSVYSPAPAVESPVDRKQSVGSIIGGYLDSETKEVETIEEE
ncbi:hypothetical protein CJU90_1107 [Yarrowia sp. C11]|nr:hypothetical protein CKK34_2520 [Yarrowia sp. E02]KAG5373409.1 hypothetical protein CJU90_1107 [Yarrowia sp. C11]